MDFQSKEEIHLPAAMIYLPYQNAPNENKIIQNISTGLACHDSYDTAAIRAICEVIERDAFMIFWKNKLAPPKIHSSSLPAHLQLILKNYQARGMDLQLLNMTTDLNIPVVLALMESRRSDQPPFLIAGACGITVESTILSAIEEIELSRQHGFHLLAKKNKAIFYARPELVKTQKDHILYWHNRKNLTHMRFLTSSKQTINYTDFCKFDFPATTNALQLLANAVFRSGMKLYLANITTEDVAHLGLFVIRAVMPEAHSLSFGYGYEQIICSRLKSVPKFLGRSNIMSNGHSNKTPHPYP